MHASSTGRRFDPQCCMALTVGRLKSDMFTVRCGGDAYVEMDVWPHEEGPSPEYDIRDGVGVAPIEEKLV